MELICQPKNGDTKLLKHCEFLEVKTRGSRYRSKFFWIQSLKSDREEASRLGIIVSRKFGNAVKRNWAKRKVREFFRLNLPLFCSGSRYVVLPRTPCLHLTHIEFDQKLAFAIQKANSIQ